LKQEAPPPPAPPPKPPAPLRVPQTEDPDVAAALRRKMLEAFGDKRGRAAANLTGGAGGGDTAYTRQTLG